MTEPEVLTLTVKEAQSIVYEDHEDFDVIEDRIIAKDDRRLLHSVVVQRLSDEKIFLSNYSRGLTDMYSHSAYDLEDPVFYEAEEKQVTVTKYVRKKAASGS